MAWDAFAAYHLAAEKACPAFSGPEVVFFAKFNSLETKELDSGFPTVRYFSVGGAWRMSRRFVRMAS